MNKMLFRRKTDFDFYLMRRPGQLCKAEADESGELVPNSSIAILLFSEASLTDEHTTLAEYQQVISRYSVLGQHLLAEM